MKFILRFCSVISTLVAYVLLASASTASESLGKTTDLGVSMLIVALALLWLSLFFNSAPTQKHNTQGTQKLWPSENSNHSSPTATDPDLGPTTQTEQARTNADQREPAKKLILSSKPQEFSPLEVYGSRNRARGKRGNRANWYGLD